ncbi:hypothetical protein [Paenibacillus spongiae]|uniref:Uncharacterized protein n=1 Tax=Paenibacillus spongiae TaxID=2909671 RepID=A0ABY5S684_9BACL|nr:hypothetical protein [Paenibacillus spongiae]UVI29422.1 hypothetical protein L1F29_29050 [Paenibacillus spongiae]
MNKNDYKRVFDSMEPDERFEQRLAQNLAKKGRSEAMGRNRRMLLYISASLAVVACAWILLITNLGGSTSNPDPVAPNPPDQTVAEGAVFLPKLELPKETNAAMDMIGLFVYQGRIYTQTSTRIPPEAAQAILGEKVGRTKGNIDEWSSQEEYAKELASSIGEQDIFTVKGYDSDFRLMTYQVEGGQVWSEFYECLNGISVSSGADVFQKLKVMGNEQSVSWESYDSWNESKKQYQEIALDETYQQFLQALYEAEPIEANKLNGIYDKGAESMKFLLITLKDQTQVHVSLHQGGYVRYVPAGVFFKVNDSAFAALWDIMK